MANNQARLDRTEIRVINNVYDIPDLLSPHFINLSGICRDNEDASSASRPNAASDRFSSYLIWQGLETWGPRTSSSSPIIELEDSHYELVGNSVAFLNLTSAGGASKSGRPFDTLHGIAWP